MQQDAITTIGGSCSKHSPSLVESNLDHDIVEPKFQVMDRLVFEIPCADLLAQDTGADEVVVCQPETHLVGLRKSQNPRGLENVSRSM
jgi:hypothetical protein